MPGRQFRSFSLTTAELRNWHAFYFTAGDLGWTSEDLWRTDGTVSGTENLQLEPIGLGSDPSFLAAGAERLYFSAYDAVAKREIHILDFQIFSDGFESGDTSAW